MWKCKKCKEPITFYAVCPYDGIVEAEELGNYKTLKLNCGSKCIETIETNEGEIEEIVDCNQQLCIDTDCSCRYEENLSTNLNGWLQANAWEDENVEV
jgi:hypothetical protein